MVPEEGAGEDLLLCCCLCVILHLKPARVRGWLEPICVWICVCECVCRLFGGEDEQRSKVRAHKAALKVIRVIPALGSSSSFPLPRTHWIRCTCTSDMVQYTVNSRLLTAIFFFTHFLYFTTVLESYSRGILFLLLVTQVRLWALEQKCSLFSLHVIS